MVVVVWWYFRSPTITYTNTVPCFSSLLPPKIVASSFLTMKLFRLCCLLSLAVCVRALGNCTRDGTMLLSIRIDESITDANVYVKTPRYEGNPAFDKPEGTFSFFESDVTKPINLCVPDDECLTVLIYRSGQAGEIYLQNKKNVFAEYGGEILRLKGPYTYIGDGSSKLAVRVDYQGSMVFLSCQLTIVFLYFLLLFDRQAQIGPCQVTCSDDEVLLELESPTNGFANHDYYLVDSATGTQVLQCPNKWTYSNSSIYRCYWDQYSYFHDRFCLPRNGCYTLVAVESSLQEYEDRPDVLTVRYDGEDIAVIENLQFAAIDFGTSDECSVLCPAQDDSLIEMFVYRWQYFDEDRPDITWALTSRDGLATVEIKGLIHPGDRPLTYFRACVADTTCASLELSVPETVDIYHETTNSTENYFESGPYRLVIDGNVYGEETYRFGGWKDDDRIYSATTFGGSCSSEQVCRNEDDALLSIAITTGPRDDEWTGWDVRWSLSSHQEGENVDYIDYDSSMLPSTSYRYLTCFDKSPEDSCAEFGIFLSGIERDNVEEYEIMVDNQVLKHGKPCRSGHCEGYLTYRLGGNCPEDNALEAGAILGIVIGALVLIVGAFVFFRRKKADNPVEQASQGTQDTGTMIHHDPEEPLDTPRDKSKE